MDVNNRIAFFGDSWVAGCEANEIDGTDCPEFAFPSHFKDSINLGVTGSSVDSIIDILYDNLDIDTAVFCLTEPVRRIFYTKENKVIDGNVSLDNEFKRELTSLSNDINDDMIVSRMCLLIYYICINHNIKPYFVNLFGSQYGVSKLWNLIPADNWLLPRDTCLVKELFDNSDWFPDYPNTAGDYTYWLRDNNNDVNRYISPCDAHPNKIGHRTIAAFIDSKINV